MLIHLARLGSKQYADVDHVAEFRWLHSMADESRHELVDSPAQADLILFVDYLFDTFFSDLAQDPTFAQYGGKCFIYDPKPFPRVVLPGIYTSSWNWAQLPSPRRSYCLLERWPGFPINPYIIHTPPEVPRDLHCVYVGAGNHPVRSRLLALDFADLPVVLEDTTAKHRHMDFSISQEQRDASLQRYAELCRCSRFMLCPAGVAPNSIRLYEAMKAGSVPVIVADHWDPPIGPEWERCAIFVPSREVARIPEILRNFTEHQWLDMAQAGHDAYERYFALGKQFNRVIELLKDIGFPAAEACARAKGRPLQAKIIHKWRAKVCKSS